MPRVVPEQLVRGLGFGLRHLTNTFPSASGLFRLVARGGPSGCPSIISSGQNFLCGQLTPACNLCPSWYHQVFNYLNFNEEDFSCSADKSQWISIHLHYESIKLYRTLVCHNERLAKISVFTNLTDYENLFGVHFTEPYMESYYTVKG